MQKSVNLFQKFVTLSLITLTLLSMLYAPLSTYAQSTNETDQNNFSTNSSKDKPKPKSPEQIKKEFEQLKKQTEEQNRLIKKADRYVTKDKKTGLYTIKPQNKTNLTKKEYDTVKRIINETNKQIKISKLIFIEKDKKTNQEQITIKQEVYKLISKQEVETIRKNLQQVIEIRRKMQNRPKKEGGFTAQSYPCEYRADPSFHWWGMEIRANDCLVNDYLRGLDLTTIISGTVAGVCGAAGAIPCSVLTALLGGVQQIAKWYLQYLSDRCGNQGMIFNVTWNGYVWPASVC